MKTVSVVLNGYLRDHHRIGLRQSESIYPLLKFDANNHVPSEPALLLQQPTRRAPFVLANAVDEALAVRSESSMSIDTQWSASEVAPETKA